MHPDTKGFEHFYPGKRDEWFQIEAIRFHDLTVCVMCSSNHLWYYAKYKDWRIQTPWGRGVLIVHEDELRVRVSGQCNQGFVYLRHQGLLAVFGVVRWLLNYGAECKRMGAIRG